MNLGELQAELRHFAAERAHGRDVAHGRLAEVLQWQTPEESRIAHEDAAAKQRIREDGGNVLLHLLHVANHCQIDVSQAVRD